MRKRLEGRNAVVTGAGRGIGRAVALALAEEGADIVVCDLGAAIDGTGADKTPSDEVVEECNKLGVRAVAHYGDVADFKAAGDMIQTCISNFGRVDILCNIASFSKTGPIFDVSEEEWDRMIDVHLKGTFNLTRHAAPLMMQQRYGRIINCTSQEYTGAGSGHVGYKAAKGGIVSLTYHIALEMGRYGVTCNAFAPRARTRMIADESILGPIKKMIEEGLIPKERFEQTLKELADPSYFASFIAYLASDAAASINGCVFLASGTSLGIWNQPVVVKEIPRDWEKEGPWRFEEIEKLVPEKLLDGYVNPAPSQPEVS